MKITVRDGDKPSYEIDLNKFGKDVVSFGRQSDCDIVIGEMCASRVHGCFYKENGITYIEDMNSTNGLRFHGNKIKRTPLNAGDTIEICKGGGRAGVVFTCISEQISNIPTPQQQLVYPPYPPYQLVGWQPLKPKLKTNRSVGTLILLFLFTFGISGISFLMGLFIAAIFFCVIFGTIYEIYTIIFFSALTDDVNTVMAGKYGNPLTGYCLMSFVFAPLTFGIYTFVWNHQLYKRVGDEARSRGISTNLGPATWWILNFLLGFTIVCHFIALYELTKTVNQICDDYNRRGF